MYSILKEQVDKLRDKELLTHTKNKATHDAYYANETIHIGSIGVFTSDNKRIIEPFPLYTPSIQLQQLNRKLLYLEIPLIHFAIKSTTLTNNDINISNVILSYLYSKNQIRKANFTNNTGPLTSHHIPNFRPSTKKRPFLTV